MSFNKEQLLTLVIRPTLNKLDLGGVSAENLLLGTCAQESNFGSYLAQINGPALGIFQMEPTTFNDIYNNFLMYRSDLATKINNISRRDVNALVYNLNYAVAMARIKYLRAPYGLPAPCDIEGLANYWKQYYNTQKGKGAVEEFIENYRKYIG